MSQPWFVLPCASANELSLEKKIRSLGYGAMAPWYDGQKYIRGNPRNWRWPLYVGYVFVSLPDPAAGWQDLNEKFNTIDRRVVFRLLGGDAPAVLRPFDALYLQTISDGRYKPEEGAAQTVVIGDCVIVPEGHFKGQESIVKKIKSDNTATLALKAEIKITIQDVPLAKIVKV